MNLSALQPQPVTSAAAPPPPRPDLTTYEDPLAEQDREDAFDDDLLEWNGRALHPFSVERYAIFVSLRRAMGAPDLYDSIRDPAAFFADALRILFLCSAEPLTLSRLRRDPDQLEAAIHAWAEDHAPVHMAGPIIQTGLRIFNSAHLNRAELRHPASPRQSGAPSGN